MRGLVAEPKGNVRATSRGALPGHAPTHFDKSSNVAARAGNASGVAAWPGRKKLPGGGRNLPARNAPGGWKQDESPTISGESAQIQ
jgi:hypothetical protein